MNAYHYAGVSFSEDEMVRIETNKEDRHHMSIGSVAKVEAGGCVVALSNDVVKYHPIALAKWKGSSK